MKLRHLISAGAVFMLAASGALAQDPSILELPVGVRVRVQTPATAGGWIKGFLASADSTTIALVPDNAPPIGANQLRLPRESVRRLEIATGKKRQWLTGLIIGAVVGVGMGFAVDVDPQRCEFDDNYACSRGEAVAMMGGTSAVMGAGIGALVKRDAWTPVGLDALPPPRVSRTGVGLRVVPGGAALAFAVSF